MEKARGILGGGRVWVLFTALAVALSLPAFAEYEPIAYNQSLLLGPGQVRFFQFSSGGATATNYTFVTPPQHGWLESLAYPWGIYFNYHANNST